MSGSSGSCVVSGPHANAEFRKMSASTISPDTTSTVNEVEPNNSFEDATQTPNEAVYIVTGAWEGSETFPAADADVWGPFDV